MHLITTGALFIDAGSLKIVSAIGLTTANDDYDRDPTRLVLSGSNDFVTYTPICTTDLMPPSARFTDYNDVVFTNTTAYRYYKMEFPLAENGNTTIQLSEIRLLGNCPGTQVGTATPLILDLNNDGVHTLIADQVVQYDLLGTGAPASVGWSSPEDGFLVFDINSDGIINDGSEMFGEATRLSNGSLAPHGFEALADLDSNLDGILDSNDPLFSSLKIWKDANSNGITDIGELFSLGDQNILSFDLSPQASERVENGNQIKLVSTYSTTDGAHHEIADVWLKMTLNPDTQSPIIG
jgi:hypothetical protein